ncbi:NAD-dependent epimerase/dehydratase family protein [Halomicrobium sp. HM KBTZ05]|uniref:NAD-dependent epimerase/dehydratase family protein n=1 Tax=Halomicrobium sp. HM KBTZ05 TaxID=3242663 RepID=UPI003558BFBE
MNALVTGHAGYIGGVLTEQLSAAGHEVVGFDNAADPADDIRDADRVEALFETEEFDVVYHLAADADVWTDDWRHLVENNVMGTATVVGVARERDVPVVFASSIAAADQVNRYGHSKHLAEGAVSEYDGVTTVRFPNVVGGPAPRGQAQDMIEQALDGEIEVWGDGEIVRPYVDVGDLCAFLRELGTGSFAVQSPAAVSSYTFTNAAVGESIQSIVAEETGTEPALSIVDRTPPSPMELSADDIRLREPTPIEASLRSQIRAAME